MEGLTQPGAKAACRQRGARLVEVELFIIVLWDVWDVWNFLSLSFCVLGCLELFIIVFLCFGMFGTFYDCLFVFWDAWNFL